MSRPNSHREHKHYQGVESDLGWLKGLLSSMGLRGFHGKVVLNYEGGRLRNVVEERRHKPPSEK